MAYSTLAASRGESFTENSTTPRTDAPVRRGLWQRFFDALIAVRQQQADREIARFLQSRGGKLTDEAEREIARRFLPRSSDNLIASWRRS